MRLAPFSIKELFGKHTERCETKHGFPKRMTFHIYVNVYRRLTNKSCEDLAVYQPKNEWSQLLIYMGNLMDDKFKKR